MTGIDSWSTTAATNATAEGGTVNWAEGQAPSTVNNTARAMLASIRAAFNKLIWFQYGTGDQGSGNLAVPALYASGTSFTIAGADVTLIYHAGRRVQAVGSGTGTIYGTISSTSYNGGNTTTTVNVTWDSGSLSNETLVISLSQIPVTGRPLPARNAFTDFGGSSPASTSSATKVMKGLGATWALTPRSSGKVRITVCGYSTNSLTGNAKINAAYGTGAAPADGAALTGTLFNTTDMLATSASSGAGPAVPFQLTSEASGLTLSTAYWFDIALGSSSGNSTAVINSVIIEELP